MKPNPPSHAPSAATTGRAAQAEAASPARGAGRPARRRARRISRREALEAAARFKIEADGKRLVVRFTLGQRIEHQLLMVSFTLLAITGLPQRFANADLGRLALQLMGGIETARQIHRLVAMLFILESAYHIGVFLYGLVVHGRRGGMWPTPTDLKHFIQMIGLNLGMSNERPSFGRYSFEEKAEYWALVWGGGVMITTGLIQMFPILVTRWLPGVAIPLARAIHGWEAVLAALAILTWHMYHVALKHFNQSMFTGALTEEEMRTEHPAELAYLERAAATLQRQSAPRPQTPPADTAPPIVAPSSPRVPAPQPESWRSGDCSGAAAAPRPAAGQVLIRSLAQSDKGSATSPQASSDGGPA